MHHIRTTLIRVGAPLLGVLGGCAAPGPTPSGTAGTCVGSSLCPVTIFERSPGVYAAFPDRIVARSNGRTSLLFTFADPSKHVFSALTGGLKPDGVDLDDPDPQKLGFGPCYITNDSKKFTELAQVGVYLRCEFKFDAKFEARPYKIRFRTRDGKPQMVDPTVESTGSADEGSTVGGANQPTAAGGIQVIKVPVGTPVVLPPLGTLGGYKVVWDAGAGSRFKGESGRVTFTDASNVPVPYNDCFVSSDDAGSDIAVDPAETRYYACLFVTPGPLKLTYTAAFTNGINVPTTAPSTLTRP